MWKSKKDLKIKELEHTIRHLHTHNCRGGNVHLNTIAS